MQTMQSSEKRSSGGEARCKSHRIQQTRLKLDHKKQMKADERKKNQTITANQRVRNRRKSKGIKRSKKKHMDGARLGAKEKNKKTPSSAKEHTGPARC